ncbi:hypothetical protein KCP74_24260 [Salmonella enterica subsp. enterica]|nr:hypothetical protein KCP74_24260 [Salmonella enterica subsp. enterica]
MSPQLPEATTRRYRRWLRQINDGSSAYPDVISNSDGFTEFSAAVAFDGVRSGVAV